MFVTPGVVVDGKLVTTDLVDINLGIRILLGSSYYDDWENAETFVKTDPLGNPVDRSPSLESNHDSAGRKNATSTDNYTWVMSPRWYHKMNRATRSIWRSIRAAAQSLVSGRLLSPAMSTLATSRPPATA